ATTSAAAPTPVFASSTEPKAATQEPSSSATPMQTDAEQEQLNQLKQLAADKQKSTVPVSKADAVAALSSNSASAAATKSDATTSESKAATATAAAKHPGKRRRAPAGDIAPKPTKRTPKKVVKIEEEDD